MEDQKETLLAGLRVNRALRVKTGDVSSLSRVQSLACRLCKIHKTEIKTKLLESLHRDFLYNINA